MRLTCPQTHCPAQIKPRLAESNFPPDWLGACGRVYHCDAPPTLRGADLASQVSPTWSDQGNLVRVLSDVTQGSLRAFSSLVRGLIYTRNVSSLLQDSLASFFKSLIHFENERHQS